MCKELEKLKNMLSSTKSGTNIFGSAVLELQSANPCTENCSKYTLFLFFLAKVERELSFSIANMAASLLKYPLYSVVSV